MAKEKTQLHEDKKDAVFHTPDLSPTCEKISRPVNHTDFSEKFTI